MRQLRKRNAEIVLAAALAGALIAPALPAQAEQAVTRPNIRPYQKQDAANPQRFFWVQDVTNRDEVQRELSRLYVELHERNVLPSRPVTIGKGDTPADVMIRGGAWPQWLDGRIELALDAALCDMNPDICTRRTVAASPTKGGGELLTVGKTRATPGDWSAAWPGKTLLVPDVKMSLDYAVVIRVPRKVGLNRSDAEIVRTSDFLQLFCRQFPDNAEHCRSRNEKGAWEPTEPIVYQYSNDGGFDPDDFKAVSNPNLLRKLGGDGGGPKLLALPRLNLEINIEEQKLQTIVQDSEAISIRGLIDKAPELEATSDAELADMRNGFKDDEGKPLIHWSSDQPVRNVRIVHVDEKADLDHCMFRDLAMRGLLKLQVWDSAARDFVPIDFEPEIASTEPVAGAVPCGTLNPHALPQGNHGTHTLGLLAKLATAGDFPELAPDASPEQAHVWPVTIMHVPSANSDVGAREMIRALERATLAWPDIVSMSLSWPSAGNGQIATVVRENLRFSLVIAAAGNQGERDRCSRLPACLDDAANVVSVVALEPDESGALKLNDQSNAGAKHHDIGAVARNIVGPIQGDMTGTMTGTSQAAPMVAATASYLMRQGVDDHLPVRRRLLSTAGLQDDLLPFARVTIINAARAVDITHDHVELRDKCRMRGKLKRIGGISPILSVSVSDDAVSQDQIDWRTVLRLFRRPANGDHMIMHMLRSNLIQRDYGLSSADLNREVTFIAEEMRECPTRAEEPVQKFNLDEVSDLIISDLKEQ